MGHSSINVSLTYLSGLEVPELKEEDMPMIYVKFLLRNILIKKLQSHLLVTLFLYQFSKVVLIAETPILKMI